MKRISKISVLSATLSLLGIVSIIAYVYYRDTHMPIYFEQPDTATIQEYGAGKDLSLQPVGPLAITDARIHYAMLAVAVVAAVVGGLLGLIQFRRGASDYFGATGLTFSAIGLVWIRLVTNGVV